MSRIGVRAATSLWTARRPHTGGDRAYVLYAVLLVAIVAVAPVLRAAWLWVMSENGRRLLTTLDAAAYVSVIATCACAVAVSVGRRRGPALLPPFLLRTLSMGPTSRATALRRPIIRTGLIVVAVFAAVATFVGVALVALERASLAGATGFALAACAMGLLTSVCWLAGQALPRAAAPMAALMFAVAAIGWLWPATRLATPWGWFGFTYPLGGGSALPAVAVTLVGVLALTTVAPLSNALRGPVLDAQVARWQRATTFTFSFDFGAAISAYDDGPRIGRRISAVRPRLPLVGVFFVADLISAFRTPVRLAVSILATATGGVLLAFACTAPSPNLALGAVAGLTVYLASAPLTKGLRHGARVAGDYPLYGVRDLTVVLAHTCFPLLTVCLILPIAAGITAAAVSAAPVVVVLGATSLGFLTVVLRLTAALQGPLPPVLLAPISTPAGDLSVLVQLAWATGDLLLAISAGITTALIAASPIPLMVVAGWTGSLLVSRWRKRR